EIPRRGGACHRTPAYDLVTLAHFRKSCTNLVRRAFIVPPGPLLVRLVALAPASHVLLQRGESEGRAAHRRKLASARAPATVASLASTIPYQFLLLSPLDFTYGAQLVDHARHSRRREKSVAPRNNGP